jgi:MFS transporter, PPP family, 3-phenylpropionic acid transporter
VRIVHVYVGYFAAFGISIPFFPAYLRGLGLSGPEVALILGVGPVCHLGVPLAWGWIADRTGRPDLLLRVACAGAALALVPLALARSLPAIVASYAVHQLFAVPILALIDSLALAQIRKSGGDYSRLRLWGSASFLACCLGAGLLFTWRGRGAGDPWVPLLMSAGYALAAVAALRVRREPAVDGGGVTLVRPNSRDVAALLRNRRFLFILVLAALHWATLAPYHAYLGILAIQRGMPPSIISQAFAVSVISEIAAFYFFPALARRFALPSLLAVASGATAVRWFLVATTSSAAALVGLQSLHALSFGLFWAAAMSWVASSVPPTLRATGQAVYTTVLFGLGNLAGYTVAGLLYDRGAGGGPALAFLAAGALAVVPCLLALAARARMSRAGSPAI